MYVVTYPSWPNNAHAPSVMCGTVVAHIVPIMQQLIGSGTAFKVVHPKRQFEWEPYSGPFYAPGCGTGLLPGECRVHVTHPMPKHPNQASSQSYKSTHAEVLNLLVTMLAKMG